MNQIKQLQLADVIQQVARRMLPFYRRIVNNNVYARNWSQAVVEADLDRMERLFNRASPRSGALLGTSAIGYNADFEFPRPFELYGNGTTIIPGTAQFVFPPRAHQAVALAVLPFYRSLALNRSFALALAAAIEANNLRTVRVLVRSRIKTKALRDIRIEDSGITLTFRFSFSRYTYRNLLSKSF